ncbi:uncharacterized protein BX664DRAFT_370335 [Halteromyces radiatus]|uniref:uncharacterized protein n=1 Tax=Halteromyces radiatus TaxID=101107 RepID=UPI00221F7ABF|nr:uncharacterized protein BX664DRAFT_370335 [Halteromyces radiatus]KAI8096640.1 hypothetical protein BX664DRAFT_370335 [Halteromyces radiatus]
MAMPLRTVFEENFQQLRENIQRQLTEHLARDERNLRALTNRFEEQEHQQFETVQSLDEFHDEFRTQMRELREHTDQSIAEARDAITTQITEVANAVDDRGEQLDDLAGVVAVQGTQIEEIANALEDQAPEPQPHFLELTFPDAEPHPESPHTNVQLLAAGDHDIHFPVALGGDARMYRARVANAQYLDALGEIMGLPPNHQHVRTMFNRLKEHANDMVVLSMFRLNRRQNVQDYHWGRLSDAQRFAAARRLERTMFHEEQVRIDRAVGSWIAYSIIQRTWQSNQRRLHLR